MNTFIEKNIKWLKFYANAARIIGWIFIIIKIAPLLLFIYIFQTVPYRDILTFKALLDIIPMEGVILLAIGQLIKYLSEYDYKAPWLLRHSIFLLYLFAVLTFISPSTWYWSISPFLIDLNMVLTLIVPDILSALVKILILIGLANILKRVLPIIEEYRSLI
jgi:hypothetical protein